MQRLFLLWETKLSTASKHFLSNRGAMHKPSMLQLILFVHHGEKAIPTGVKVMHPGEKAVNQIILLAFVQSFYSL